MTAPDTAGRERRAAARSKIKSIVLWHSHLHGDSLERVTDQIMEIADTITPTDAASAAEGSVTIPADHVDALKDAADHWHQAAEDLIAASNLLRSTIAAAESAEASGEEE